MWDFCRTTQGDVLNVMGAIFVSAMFLGTSNSSTVQPVFAIERAVMYRYLSSLSFCTACFGPMTRLKTVADRLDRGMSMRDGRLASRKLPWYACDIITGVGLHFSHHPVCAGRERQGCML